MMILVLLAVTAMLLAYANGANDNLKGFATLWGSGAINFHAAACSTFFKYMPV